MAGQPELFVVCRGCGREVSPYITECPYCGSRLRRRAPRLERRDGELEPLEDDGGGRTGLPLIGRGRGGRRADTGERAGGGRRGDGGARTPRGAPGAASSARGGRRRRERPERSGLLTAPRLDARPWATIVLVALSLVGLLVVSVLARVGLAGAGLGAGELLGGPERWWWPGPAAFLYANGWQQIATVLPLGLFAWLWERRAGPLVPIGTFLVAGIGGLALSRLVQPGAPEIGGAGAAAALAVAWIVAELRARRRGDGDGDLVGAWVLAAVAVAAAPFALQGAAVLGAPIVAPVAAAAGSLLGVPLGLLLARAGR